MPELNFPTEIISLPSKGYFYPETSPLASGQVELRYMTARDEDILTSSNLIKKGIVLDKLLESLIVDKRISPDDFLTGDKNAILLAARILGYGKDYSVRLECPECEAPKEESVDLSKMEDKPIDFSELEKGSNSFQFTLPFSRQVVIFKLLTSKDHKLMNAELDSIKKKIGGEISHDVTTRMIRSIISINGDTSSKEIRTAVENMPARDAMAFREYAKVINPGLDVSFDFHCEACGYEKRMEVPIDSGFFWPKS